MSSNKPCSPSAPSNYEFDMYFSTRTTWGWSTTWLANLTSCSPLLTLKLRKLWSILDNNDISVRARYIMTTANISADRLNRDIDYDDMAFNLRHLDHLDNI